MEEMKGGQGRSVTGIAIGTSPMTSLAACRFLPGVPFGGLISAQRRQSAFLHTQAPSARPWRRRTGAGTNCHCPDELVGSGQASRTHGPSLRGLRAMAGAPTNEAKT